MVDGKTAQQCCFLNQTEIRYSQPGDQILYYWKEAKLRCKRGWTGRNCDTCAPNFGPSGQCDSCLKGWSGLNCDSCATGWAGPGCDGCATGWIGTDCDSCATNFGPDGRCDRCLTSWTGDNCNYCEGFGFSIESNCTGCIQNGYWKGNKGSRYLDVHLTFTGETCSELVPGMCTSTYDSTYSNLELY